MEWCRAVTTKRKLRGSNARRDDQPHASLARPIRVHCPLAELREVISAAESRKSVSTVFVQFDRETFYLESGQAVRFK